MSEQAVDSPGDPLSRRFTLIVVLCSLVLTAPALAAGFWMDDYYFGSTLIPQSIPFGLYEFGDKLQAQELAPWWTSPDFRILFFRPLSSAALALDFYVLGGHPLVAHLHSALWFVLLLLGAFRLFGAQLPARPARWAAVIFAVSACHGFTAGWIAARHAVMGSAIALWSVSYYLAWRAGGARWQGLVALGLFAVGLLSSETALAVTALVVAYELAGARGAWKTRLAAATPYVGLAVAYLVYYKAAGYGVVGSSVYADPSISPGRFVAEVPGKVVSMLGTYVFGVPTSLSYMPGLRHVPLFVGSVALLLTAGGLAASWGQLEDDRRRGLRWLGLGALLALGPGLAALPQGRSAVLSFCAFAAVAGLLVATLWSHPATGLRRVLNLGLAGLLCLGLLLSSGLLRLATGAMGYSTGKAELKLAKQSPLRCVRGSRVYLLNGGLLFSLKAPFIVAHHRGKFFASWHQLTEPATDLYVSRAGDEQLEITGRGKPLINRFMVRVLHSRPESLKPGRVLGTPRLRVEVLEATGQGPTRARFTIPGLTDPTRVCLLAYDYKAGLLKHVSPPETGKSMRLKFVLPTP